MMPKITYIILLIILTVHTWCSHRLSTLVVHNMLYTLRQFAVHILCFVAGENVVSEQTSEMASFEAGE